MGSLVISVLAAALLCALVVCAGQAEQFGDVPRPTSILSADITTEDGSGTYALPRSIGSLSPHSAGVMTFSAKVERGDVLCLHSVYTSYKVYADGQLLASIGDNPPSSCGTRPLRCTRSRLTTWRAGPTSALSS